MTQVDQFSMLFELKVNYTLKNKLILSFWVNLSKAFDETRDQTW